MIIFLSKTIESNILTPEQQAEQAEKRREQKKEDNIHFGTAIGAAFGTAMNDVFGRLAFGQQPTHFQGFGRVSPPSENVFTCKYCSSPINTRFCGDYGKDQN